MKNDSQLMRASLWLQEALADGPMPAAEVRSAGAIAGHKPMTIRRAGGRLAVVAQKRGFGKGARWLWRLPRAEDVQDERVRRSEIDGDLGDLSFGMDDLGDLSPWTDDELHELNTALETELQDFSIPASKPRRR